MKVREFMSNFFLIGEQKAANKLLWDLLASQFNTLRKVYKEFYGELKRENKSSKLKLRIKRKQYKARYVFPN